jgi:non-heme chloroperoxidase
MPSPCEPSASSDPRSAGWERVRVEGEVEIAYTQRGSGEPVVLVPGWTMSGEVFEHQLAGLADRFRVVTFDPRSQGRSSRTLTGNDYPQQGRDLIALLATLGIDEFHLVGWSYGGLACYATIAQVGMERVRSLTVVDMTPTPLGTGAAGEWAEAALDGFLDGFIAPVVSDPEAFAADFAAWLVARALAPREQEWLASMHLATPRHACESLLVSAMFSDYAELASSIDARIPFANAIRRDWMDDAVPWLREHAPNAAVWSMPSHLGFWEEPTEFNAHLTEFLTRAR